MSDVVESARLAGSFRDPRGYVFKRDGRLFRCIRDTAISEFDAVEKSGLLAEWQKQGELAGYKDVDTDALPPQTVDAGDRVIELDPVRFISHPYEWSFSALQAAALLQLRMLRKAVSQNVIATDASAYNVQFIGTRPLFIDQLSWRPYREGELWQAHGQFCEQFLFPLLLQAYAGLPFNDWYRGRLEGITGRDLLRVLPYRHRFRLNVFVQLVLPQILEDRYAKRGSENVENLTSEKRLPKASLINMLKSMESWIGRLQPGFAAQSVWSEYYCNNSYSDDEAAKKREFVASAIAACKPGLLWDLGCNTGNFALLALDAGAESVVGFESDPKTADIAFRKAAASSAQFLPLVQNLANPSPDQGWLQHERQGLQARATTDFVLALALVHHMRFHANIPLERVVEWLISLAPAGIIEFPQKSDPMVRQMLLNRDNLFDDYTEENFTNAVREHANVVRCETLPVSGRLLLHFSR